MEKEAFLLRPGFRGETGEVCREEGLVEEEQEKI